MNKLFLITWRWLKRDKKRTALTFCSIVLAVYLISFVGVYMSTALSSYKASKAYSEPFHAVIDLDDTEQTKALDKNAAWEAHCLYINSPFFLSDSWIERYGSSEDSLFPLIEINGKNAFTEDYVYGTVIKGDADKVMGESVFQLTGELPSQAHEVAVSRALAAKFGGLDIGDTITIKMGAQKGTLYYAELTGNRPYHRPPKRDENGELTYIEDTDGELLKSAYATVTEYEAFKVFRRFMSAANGGKIDETTFTVYGDGFNNALDIPSAYAVLSGEPEIDLEYTATITGLTDSGSNGSITGDIVFSPDDSDMLPFFENKPIRYYLRAKPGIDAELAIQKAIENVGIDDPDHTRYELNAELLILEGRQLEYLGKVAEMFALAAIVLWMFVFLARLIINNAFEISAAYRTEQYGALKTVGASDKQIFTMIMFECLLYMLTALPLGFFGAVAVGKLLLKKIQEIGVFDPIYGEGVSERFFTMELSPLVMIVTFACAAFSIFFSSYADAMRVRRMPPIQSVGYGSQKKARNKRSLWLSRRFLGYPSGFALKCISKQKVRFTVTLLAAVMSGIFIMSFAGMASVYSNLHETYTDITPDIETYYWMNSENKTIDDMKDAYDTFEASGLFDDIDPKIYILLWDGDTEDFQSNASYSQYLTDEFKAVLDQDYRGMNGIYMDGLMINAVTREMYEKHVISDMTYDEFAASGKVLLSKTVSEEFYDDLYVTKYWHDMNIKVKEAYMLDDSLYCEVFDIEPFADESFTKLELTGKYHAENDLANTFKVTESVEIGGFYETDSPDLMISAHPLVGILPFESFPTDTFETQKQHCDVTVFDGFRLNIKEGCIGQARTLVENTLQLDGMNDNTTQKLFNGRAIQALRIAGFGFAISLAVIVLLNIFSTTGANMINRRRDFSMMRSCGMSVKQVRRSLFFEARIYAVVTALIGSLIGWILAVFMYNLFFGKYDFDPNLIVIYIRYFPWQASIAVFAVIMLTMSSAILPSLASMKKQNIAEEIRTDI